MDILVVATFCVALISSMLSGIAGGGGGYLMAPYWLIAGMTPAQGATTGGFMAVGMGASALVAFRGTPYLPAGRKLMTALAVFTVFASVVGAVTLTHIEAESFKMLLAAMTLASIPLLFLDKDGIRLSPRYRAVGIGLFLLVLLASSIITSSAFSILMTVGLSQLFGLSTLQSTAVRRVIGLVQSGVIFAVLAMQGNFLPMHACAAIAGGSLGSYIGTRIAIRGGEAFARIALAVGALLGAAALVIY